MRETQARSLLFPGISRVLRLTVVLPTLLPDIVPHLIRVMILIPESYRWRSIQGTLGSVCLTIR